MRSIFWKKLEIEWDHNFLRPIRFSEHLKAILAYFLNRTQGGPFSFSLFREGGYVDKDHARWIIKDLLDHSRQWEEVFIRIFDPNLLRNAKGRLPLLKKLEITSTAYFGPLAHPSFAFKDAPLLTHVVLGDIRVWEFNWSSLTILGIGHQPHIYKSLTILQKSVNLVELTFSDHFTYWGVQDSGLMIHLPRLECLSTVDITILIVLETPALRRLEKVQRNSLSDEVLSYVVIDKMVDFLRRSWLKLTFVECQSNKVVLHTSTF